MGIVSQKKVILLNRKKFNVVGFWPFKTIGSIENMVILVVHLIYVSRVFFDRKKNTYLVYAPILMDNQLHLEKVYLSTVIVFIGI